MHEIDVIDRVDRSLYEKITSSTGDISLRFDSGGGLLIVARDLVEHLEKRRSTAIIHRAASSAAMVALACDTRHMVDTGMIVLHIVTYLLRGQDFIGKDARLLRHDLEYFANNVFWQTKWLEDHFPAFKLSDEQQEMLETGRVEIVAERALELGMVHKVISAVPA